MSTGPTPHAPMYDTEVLWSWNANGAESAIEANLHDFKRTVIITERDIRKMAKAVGLEVGS